MTIQNIRSIAHPTDLSDLSGVAFAHALRIALATRSKLHLLHVVPQDTGAALAFPHVRQLLVQWGLAEEDDPPWVVLTGRRIVVHLVHVGSSAPPVPAASAGHHLPPVMLRHGNVASTIVDVAIEFEVDLIGMPTAGHRNPLDLLRGSATERVIRHAPCPVLAVPAG